MKAAELFTANNKVRMTLYHDIPAGPKITDVINVIVEIPKGSRNKYEYDKKTDMIRLDRVLFSSIFYVGDYGMIPQTLSEDGDPLDVLVLVTNPTYPARTEAGRTLDRYKTLNQTLRYLLQ
jgi:inorganic pyrophosphatase